MGVATASGLDGAWAWGRHPAFEDERPRDCCVCAVWSCFFFFSLSVAWWRDRFGAALPNQLWGY